LAIDVMVKSRIENHESRIAMGCMRFSTERDRDESRALAVLHAAFDAGITVLDTADAYCWDATEAGHSAANGGRQTMR
jgi:aryl-alcohol dehydrogenase-like predicted oxidoreductase